MEWISTAFGFVLGIVGTLFTEWFTIWRKRPGITVSFHPDENCLREANAEMTAGLRVFEKEMKFVRVKVTNRRRYPARACRCFVTAIRKSSANETKTVFADTLPLRWAYLDFLPIDIPAQTTFYADILSTQANQNYFRMEMNPLPLHFHHSTTERARYEIDMSVVGDNFDPVSFRLHLDWKQNWDVLDVWSEST